MTRLEKYRLYDRIEARGGLLPPTHYEIKSALGFEHNETMPDDFKTKLSIRGWEIEVVTRATNFQHRIWYKCPYCRERRSAATVHFCEEMEFAKI
jgi:hypothetical protein